MEHTEAVGCPSRHVIRGEYLHKGIIYGIAFPKQTLEEIEDFNYKPDDIILATYPKTGTTWMQEIMHGVVNCEALQRSEEKSSPTLVSFPFLEFVDWDEPYPGLKDLEKMASPRLMKTHLRKYFFEKPLKQNNKIVVVLRNVKDTMASYYHFYQKWDDFAFKGHDFDEFFELFREKRLCYGDWYDWVLDWWTEKDNPNVCFFFYENMKADIHKETRRLAAFLGKELNEEQFQFVVNRAEFDCMQRGAARSTDDKRENAGKKVLFRKGLVGDWRSHFSEQQAKYVDDLTTEKLAGTGLHFRNS